MGTKSGLNGMPRAPQQKDTRTRRALARLAGAIKFTVGTPTIQVNQSGVIDLVLGTTILTTDETGLIFEVAPANTAFMGPTSGSDATPTFRAIVAADIPFAAISPLTTKGDLWGFDTTNARVPVGIDNRGLFADSSDAQGLSYFGAIRTLDSQTTAVSQTGAGGALMSYTVPGGTLASAGDSVQVETCLNAASAVGNLTITITYGSQTINTTTLATFTGGLAIRIRIVRITATTQHIFVESISGTVVVLIVIPLTTGPVFGPKDTYTAGTATLSSDQAISFSASTTSGTITQEYMITSLQTL